MTSPQTAARPPLLTAIGGPRGIVDGGLPPLVFVVVHAVSARRARLAVGRPRFGGRRAGGTGLAIAVPRLLRR